MPIGLRGTQHVPWRYKREIFRLLEYKPYPEPLRFHKCTASHRILAGGNRSGKSFAAAHEIIPYLLLPYTKGWVVARHYSLVEPLFEHIVDALVYKLGMRQVPQSCVQDIGDFSYSKRSHYISMWNGAFLEGKSADNPDSLHAVALDYCVIEEAALFPYDLYLTRIIPRMVDSGGWIAAIGTFEDQYGTWFRDWWETGQLENDRDIVSFSHPTTANPAVDQDWLMEQREILGDALFQARFLGIPQPSEFLVFPQFSILEHVTPEHTEYDPALPVYIGVDPGSTYAVVACQFKFIEGRGLTCCVFDEEYCKHTTSTVSVAMAVKKRPWFKKLGREGPAGAIDVAAREQREIWNREFLKGRYKLRAKKVPVVAGIQTLAHWLEEGRILIHPSVKWLPREFTRWEWQRKRIPGDRRGTKPVEAWNHAIKALIYLIVNLHGFHRAVRTPTRHPSKRKWGAARGARSRL